MSASGLATMLRTASSARFGVQETECAQRALQFRQGRLADAAQLQIGARGQFDQTVAEPRRAIGDRLGAVEAQAAAGTRRRTSRPSPVSHRRAARRDTSPCAAQRARSCGGPPHLGENRRRRIAPRGPQAAPRRLLEPLGHAAPRLADWRRRGSRARVSSPQVASNSRSKWRLGDGVGQRGIGEQIVDRFGDLRRAAKAVAHLPREPARIGRPAAQRRARSPRRSVRTTRLLRPRRVDVIERRRCRRAAGRRRRSRPRVRRRRRSRARPARQVLHMDEGVGGGDAARETPRAARLPSPSPS